jgi:hypothetical protein
MLTKSGAEEIEKILNEFNEAREKELEESRVKEAKKKASHSLLNPVKWKTDTPNLEIIRQSDILNSDTTIFQWKTYDTVIISSPLWNYTTVSGV